MKWRLFIYCAMAACGVSAAFADGLEITQDIIPPGRCGRPMHRPMQPTYITIHSTDNPSAGADARRHALAMKNGVTAEWR